MTEKTRLERDQARAGVNVSPRPAFGAQQQAKSYQDCKRKRDKTLHGKPFSVKGRFGGLEAAHCCSDEERPKNKGIQTKDTVWWR
jgi:hypothetical protein